MREKASVINHDHSRWRQLKLKVITRREKYLNCHCDNKTFIMEQERSAQARGSDVTGPEVPRSFRRFYGRDGKKYH